MVKYYRCKSCGYQFVMGTKSTNKPLTCGAVVSVVFADNPEASNDCIDSMGIKPLGCGGEIEEISFERAMSYVRR